jgi:hypothetical protein
MFIRYVAFDPLGHKLVTGISNAPHNQTQWDRVAAPSCQGSSLTSASHHPRSPVFQPDRERRIAVCYRSLVEQYEQLVQRYYNLSRSRTPTVSIYSCRCGTVDLECIPCISRGLMLVTVLAEFCEQNHNIYFKALDLCIFS